VIYVALQLPVVTRVRERIKTVRTRLGLFAQVRALTPQQEELMKKFRKGLADALGIPEEAIREDILRRWVTEWTRAIVSPEYLKEHPELLAMIEG
jgi:hypothetical protein